MALWLYKKIRDKQRRTESPEPWTESNQLEDRDVPGAELQNREGEQPSREQSLNDGRTATTNEEKKATRRYRWRLIAGLFIPASVQALNTTMIAGALPFIASDFSTSASP